MKEIKENIKNCVTMINTENINWFNVLGNAHMVKSVDIAIEYLDCNGNDAVFNVTTEVWTDAIQNAINNYKNVYIPYINNTIYINRPLIVHSNCNIKIDENQTIALLPNVNTCMIRNENVLDGSKGVTDNSHRDKNISIDGGIWTTCANGSKSANGNKIGYVDINKKMQGSSGVIILHNIENVNVRNITIKECASYGVQIGDCSDFIVENINFISQKRDGVHLNGPSQYGIIRNLKGKDMGDDIVALNAWDWYDSAITFGYIKNVIVENIQSDNNEFRILPGRKIFYDGSYVDCDISECVFENIKGIYTFKIYCQPNIANAISEINDTSGTVGNINNLNFKNIEFDKVRSSGLNDLPVGSLFEICADCDNLFFEDIKINYTEEEVKDENIHFMNVGPLSATWKSNSDDPKCWGEVFSPDDICTVDNIYMKGIMFKTKKSKYEAVDDIDLLLQEIHLSINYDYPNTTPRGGNGYGILKKVTVEK